jgi:hypothetical protein
LKSVLLKQAYQSEDGFPTLEFEVKMKTVHDEKGKFSIGLMLMGKIDPKLVIFDDDRNIIGAFDKKENAIRFLDKVIEKRIIKQKIIYKYPVSQYGTGYLVGVPNIIEMELIIDNDRLKGFQLSKDVLEKGKLPEEKMQKWRFS